MRTNTLSVIVIVLALAALVAGYASGTAGTHPPAVATLHRSLAAKDDAAPRPSQSQGASSDAPVVDLFSDDDVVVERTDAASTAWRPQRLSIVIGLCGDGSRVEDAFLHEGVPLAYDLDPHAPDALHFARLAHDAGALLLVHVSSPPSAQTLQSLRARFGDFDGVASRTSEGMARALAGTGLVFFDERGDADPHPFAAAHVAFVSRDATVDDRSAESYIAFMLDRAAQRSQREGRLVVLMRPLPSSLAALGTFLQTRNAQIAKLTPKVE